MIRVHGDVRKINVPAMDHTQVHDMVYDIMNDGQRKIYEENKEVDFSFEVPGLARFRVNAFVRHDLSVVHRYVAGSLGDSSALWLSLQD